MPVELVIKNSAMKFVEGYVLRNASGFLSFRNNDILIKGLLMKVVRQNLNTFVGYGVGRRIPQVPTVITVDAKPVESHQFVWDQRKNRMQRPRRKSIKLAVTI